MRDSHLRLVSPLTKADGAADALDTALRVIKCMATFERAVRYAARSNSLDSMTHRRARLHKIRGALTRSIMHFGDARARQGVIS